MSRSQWKRLQRHKRAEKEAAEKSVIGKDADSKDKAESSNNAQIVSIEEISHQINPGNVVEPVVSKEKIMIESWRSKTRDEMEEETMVHRPVCYYVMNNGCVEEHNAFFERPDDSMKAHLKPLFIKAKVENVGVNKILVD
ncbi:hypothetical protein KIW84_074822 [Lathyrus oleraceus]|uniref:Uncharacterized protein n=1 Tax=Pisum sativum TaxID=3888 RepID=A0A9D4VTE1_PEA|nr:hypothetical protein KIW84_074822 [Pisum sativum]